MSVATVAAKNSVFSGFFEDWPPDCSPVANFFAEIGEKHLTKYRHDV
jgi:hypothetical protein